MEALIQLILNVYIYFNWNVLLLIAVLKTTRFYSLRSIFSFKQQSYLNVKDDYRKIISLWKDIVAVAIFNCLASLSENIVTEILYNM